MASPAEPPSAATANISPTHDNPTAMAATASPETPIAEVPQQEQPLTPPPSTAHDLLAPKARVPAAPFPTPLSSSTTSAGTGPSAIPPTPAQPEAEPRLGQDNDDIETVGLSRSAPGLAYDSAVYDSDTESSTPSMLNTTSPGLAPGPGPVPGPVAPVAATHSLPRPRRRGNRGVLNSGGNALARAVPPAARRGAGLGGGELIRATNPVQAPMAAGPVGGVAGDVPAAGKGLTVKMNLNLDVEIELKAKVQGDITLSLL